MRSVHHLAGLVFAAFPLLAPLERRMAMVKITRSWRAYRLLLLGSVALAAAACSDAPSAPSAAIKSVPTVAHDVSYQSGSQLVVVDQTGPTLTLDASAHELRIDDGRVYLLSSAQTAEFATDFQNTITYDQLSTQVQYLPPPACGDFSGCYEGQTRVLPTVPILMQGKPDKDNRRGGHRVAPEGFDPSMGAFSVPQTTTSKPTLNGRIGTRPSFDDLTFLPDCQSMKTDIIVAMAAYRNDRATVDQRWLENGLAGFIYQAGRFVKSLTLPEANVFLANIEADLVAKRWSETNLDVMRVAYTSNLCGTISWAGANAGVSPAGTSISGYPMVCSVERWMISFDGGNTWRSINVDSCQFATQ
jgi:hypothetical protein